MGFESPPIDSEVGTDTNTDKDFSGKIKRFLLNELDTYIHERKKESRLQKDESN